MRENTPCSDYSYLLFLGAVGVFSRNGAERIRFSLSLIFLKTTTTRVVGGFRQDRLLVGREFVCGREPGLVGARVVVL